MIPSLGAWPAGIAGVAVTDASNIARQLQKVTQQASDGLISDTYSGLGSGMRAALVTAPAIAQQTTLQTNIAAASGPMQVAQTALSQISAIASQFYAQTDNLNGLNPSETDSIASSARDALTQVADLLNSTDAGTYVFAGQDSGNPPVPNGDGILSSGFFQQIQTSVQSLGAVGATATIQATLTTAQSNVTGTTPFSAYLSQPGAAVRPVLIDLDGSQVPTGILANANGDVVSAGASTSGSYIRDVLRGLATIGSLSSGQVNVVGFSTLVADTRTSLGDAITALNQDAGVLGNRQAALTTAAQTSSSTVTALQSQLSNAQDVDMAATLTQLSQTQTQLRNSYQLIADSQSLSLVKYLSPTG